jgi:hypothetical protein
MQLDIDTYDIYDFQPGEPLHDLLQKKIKESDFAVIVATEINANVFYEMGICEGLGKPLFIIVGKEMKAPYFVDKHVHLNTDLRNADLLKISLSKFLERLRSGKSKPRRSKSIAANRTLNSLDDYLSTIRRMRQEGSALEVDKLADEIFKRLNFQFEPNRFTGSGDRGVDYAIWNDNLTFALGNPLLIEIKAGSLTPHIIHTTENRLKHYLAKTNAKSGILLYLDRNGRRFQENYSVDPLILRYDLEDFIEALSKSTFENVVLSKRNEMIHGVSE